jgi:hypothetical protein
MDVFRLVNKPMSIIQSIMLQEKSMLLKSTKHPFSYLKIEIDMSVDNSDSEEDIVHQIQGKWLLNGLKNN